MTCSYCRAENLDTEHRCLRCGRRLGPDLPATVGWGLKPLRGSALPQPAKADDPPRVATPAALPPRQRPLFPQRVVQLEGASPRRRTAQAPAPLHHKPVFGSPVPPPGARQVPRRRKPPPGQQDLPLNEPAEAVEPAAPRERPHPTDDAERRVAGLLHRSLAAMLDTAVVLAGAAVLLITIRLCGATPDFWNRSNQAVLGAAVLALAAFYCLLGVLWERDSPGMVWTRLCLVNRDGLRPTRTQRLWRLAGVLLCFASAGFGFFWALTDQQRLGWHDHISRTFPTPRL